MAGKLTKRQELFVAEYLIDLNATRAAKRAGYSHAGAEVAGSKLLRNPKVSAAITEKHEQRLEKLEISADTVLQELAKLAFLDPGDFFEDDGSLKRIKDLDDNTRKAIAGLEVIELFEGTGEQKHAYGLLKKLKLADKGVNLERLGKHLKLFTDKVEVSGAVTLVHSVPRPVRK
jgi:phage terminase small subunit